MLYPLSNGGYHDCWFQVDEADEGCEFGKFQSSTEVANLRGSVLSKLNLVIYQMFAVMDVYCGSTVCQKTREFSSKKLEETLENYSEWATTDLPQWRYGNSRWRNSSLYRWKR